MAQRAVAVMGSPESEKSASAEHALRESEERYRKLVEESPLAIVILQDGRFAYSNPAHCDIVGYREEELRAMTPEEMASMIHPDDRDLVFGRIRDRLAGLRVPDRYEFRARHRSGEYRWVEICASVVQYSGRPAVQATAGDVTDRKAAEERLAARERYFRSLIERTSDAILVVAPDNSPRYASPSIEELTGYSADEFVQLSPAEVLEPEALQHVNQLTEELLADPKRCHRFAGRLRRKDGSFRRFDSTAKALAEEAGGPGLVVSLRDVTEQWEAEQKLAQAQKLEAIGRLAGGVAHDFNNILTVVLAECDTALRRLRRGESVEAQLAEVNTAAERAGSLTRQLLAFSRRQFVEPTVFELAEVVRDLQPMLRRLLDDRVELRCETSDDTGVVRADRGQLEQVLLNLVVNARDAMPEGGSLLIEAKPRGGDAILAVEDTGVGIDDAIKARLFEPFFTTKDSGKGTGLGLATCYGIVKRFDGAIEVHSRKGAGARFEVRLPRAADTAVHREEDDTEPRWGTETVLLVEDEPPLRRVLAGALRERGYQVSAAASAEEALSHLDQHRGPLHLLITDLVLPGLDGQALAERVREERPHTRVVFMTGHSEGLLQSRPDRSHFILLKPFSLETLALRVRRALDGE